MAKITLLQKLRAMATLTFVFSNVTSARDQDGKQIAILTLGEPIPTVRGSQEIDFDGQRHPVVAHDVTEIKVHEDNMNDDFVVNEDGTVTYEGDSLILDVAKSTRQVWLVGESYASLGNKMRQVSRNERIAKLLDLDSANPASGPNAGNSNTGKPTVVDTNAGKQPTKIGG